MAELKPYRGGYYLWKYLPSKAAAIVFLILFLVATAAVAWRMYKTKTWYCSVFVIGGMFEVIGYAARSTAYDKTDKLMPFVIQNSFILLAPVLFAASIYMVLRRVILQVHGEAHSIIPVKWLTKIFVLGDLLSFMVQGSAAGLMATGDNAEMGQNIVIGGLFIQIAIFGFFMATTLVFQLRMRRAPTAESEDPSNPWESRIYMLHSCSALVMVRSTFRVVEFIMGHDGYLLAHEWPLYVFDSVLMFAVMVIFFSQYPAPGKLRGWKGGLVPLQSVS
ncbi:RTA1 like protein-domain-containing protein [Dactylonectria estremocensis]|uniref:RTA1 like protein-domain-containing protein n=1 Tax=Dactylonectria estremocensis TaxID=1079267 RepID=A0A9P9DWQ4_9HYPO|nr:RTA1 like protein-domain-containing protein [Dactylonectria estremocensis]